MNTPQSYRHLLQQHFDNSCLQPTQIEIAIDNETIAAFSAN